MTYPHRCAIGIDFGSTHSCVGIYKNDRVDIIANDQGDRTTLSLVAFTDNEILVGNAAKNQAPFNSENTVFGMKRFIGRSFDDCMVQIENWTFPFKVVNVEGIPAIVVNHKGDRKQFSPEEISAIVLKKMKDAAEAYLGHEVQDAVIAVPVYFNDQQRQATKEAALIAGLKCLRIINEDCGGHCLCVEDAIVETLSNAGDQHLGGDEFDQLMVAYCFSDCKEKTGHDISENIVALGRLKAACEQAKRVLSSSEEAEIVVDSLFEGYDYKESLTREGFELLLKRYDLLERIHRTIEQALKEAKLNKESIRDIVMVGGSSKIPLVHRIVKEFFGGKELLNAIHPDEVVAHGAAIQAAILSGSMKGCEHIIDCLYHPIAYLGLGIETAGGLMSTIVPRNTTIPIRRSQTFTTYEDNQTSVYIKVYEGERALARDNRWLGTLVLSGISPDLRRIPQIEVTFDIDANELLFVIARETRAEKQSRISINNLTGRPNEKEAERLINEACEHEEADRKTKEEIIASIGLDSVLALEKGPIICR